MDAAHIIVGLEQLTERLGIEVRYSAGVEEGGLCRIGSTRIIIVGLDLANEDKIEILAHALALPEIDDIHLNPEIREVIEKYGGG